MLSPGRAIASTFAVFVALIFPADAFGATVSRTVAAAPIVAGFRVDPQFTAWPPDSGTTVVTVGWDVRNHVSRITIFGGVDKLGIPLPFTSRTPSGKRSHKTIKLRVRCDGTTQTLMLTAMGPGGTTKANTSIREQTNP